MTCKVLRHQDNWGTPQAKYEPTPHKYQPTPHKYQPTPHKYEPSPTKYEPSPTKYEPTPHRADLRRLRDNSTRAGGALRGGPAKKKPAKRVGGTYDVYVIPNLDPTMGERKLPRLLVSWFHSSQDASNDRADRRGARRRH